MKLTTENKLKILENIYQIKRICSIIETEILGGQCWDSGTFPEIAWLSLQVDKLKEINNEK